MPKPAHPPSPRDLAQTAIPLHGESEFQMTDVGAKPITTRRAIACGCLKASATAFQALKNGTLPKGNALHAAEIAGMMAAKQTATFLPLCHPLPLNKVHITFTLSEPECRVTVHCDVSASARTGVEMEALMGVNGALLCLYDLLKPVDPALTLERIRLELKEGGKKGTWVHPDAAEEWHKIDQLLPFNGYTAALVVLSDRASSGTYEDLAGPALQRALEQKGAKVCIYKVIPDDAPRLEHFIEKWAAPDSGVDFILTSGGTGPSKRDITPDVIQAQADKLLPGIGEALRQHGQQFTKTTWLSRSVAAVKNTTILVTLPGNPKAILESLPVLEGVLPTAMNILRKDAS